MKNEILELNSNAKEEGKNYSKKRFAYNQIKRHLEERIFIALIGPRGVGKTIILKQILSETDSSFYISLDTQRLENSIFETAKELSEKGIKLLLLDEVHTYPNFEKDLKKTHDFLGINIIFTSSSAISLQESSYDLSRRVRIIKIPPFSLRELALFENNEEIKAIKLEEIENVKTAKEIYGKTIHLEKLFERYLQGKNYPFTLGKTDFLPLFSSILDTIIQKDLLLTGRATPEETIEIEKMLKFIGTSRAEDINHTSLAKNLGITKYKIEKYCKLLEKAFVLKQIYPRGTNVLKEPKILLSLPYRLLYKKYEDCIGALREDFFTDELANQGIEFFYLKSKRGEKVPDYLVNETVFEIGGASKGTSQFKGITAENKIILTQPGQLTNEKRPLYLIGLI